MKTLRNYLYNLTYQILTLIVPLITTPYLSRVLRADGIGRYSITQAIVEYFVLFGLLGMATYGSRQIAYVRDDDKAKKQAFWDLNTTRLITMSVSTIAYICFCIINKENRTLYIMQFFTVAASLIDISWYFAGIENFKKTALRNIIIKIISVILIFAFVKQKKDIYVYALIISLSLFIGQIVLWIGIFNDVDYRKPIWKNVRTYLLGSFKLWLPTIAASVYTSFDKLMLGYFTDDVQVGIYVNSQKIVKIATTITTALATVTIPQAANSFTNGRMDELQRTVYKSLTAVSFLAFPMCMGLMAVRETLVPWFLGSGFEEVEDLLLISSLLIITLSWSSILANQVLVASKRENMYTIAIVLAAIVNFGLNLILIPCLKSTGALITSVLAEYLGMFTMFYFSRNIISAKVFAKKISKYFLSASLMYIVVYAEGKFLPANIFTTGIQIITGGIIYIGMMVLMKDEMIYYFIDCTLQRGQR